MRRRFCFCHPKTCGRRSPFNSAATGSPSSPACRNGRIASLRFTKRKARCPRLRPPPALALVPDADGKTAVIDTGAASFRIAHGEGRDVVTPLVAVRGHDGVWRGEGRFRLRGGVTILSRRTQVLEAGALVLTARIDYALSNQTNLLVDRDGPSRRGLPARAGDFAGNRRRGVRLFPARIQRWSRLPALVSRKRQRQHWTDLSREERELARIQESVAWWLPPQGFGYGMSSRDFAQKDFIAVFSRRRGEWIDRKFASVTQGPGENRELDWPFPEMVGSTVSMITAHNRRIGRCLFSLRLFRRRAAMGHPRFRRRPQ